MKIVADNLGGEANDLIIEIHDEGDRVTIDWQDHKKNPQRLAIYLDASDSRRKFLAMLEAFTAAYRSFLK